MLKLMEGNKRYLFWVVVFGLFGIVGLLMVPIVKCIIRVSERHPKALRMELSRYVQSKNPLNMIDRDRCT